LNFVLPVLAKDLFFLSPFFLIFISILKQKNSFLAMELGKEKNKRRTNQTHRRQAQPNP
jgi:hypothetical protein